MTIISITDGYFAVVRVAHFSKQEHDVLRLQLGASQCRLINSLVENIGAEVDHNILCNMKVP